MERKNIIVICMFLVIVNSYFVAGFGASADYWDDKPLKLKAGEMREIELRLQNLAGSSEDIVLRANLQEGEDIAIFVDEELDYVVPFGSENVPVKIIVETPEDAEIGTSYYLLVSFDQLATADDSFLQIAGAVKKRIPVEIVGEEKSSGSQGITGLVIISLIVISGVALFVYRRRKIKNSDLNK
jgi:hypothetical protein